ncbi:MAG: hypothetical protein JXA46_19330 [Dehalococcoidales bacterium]|nr:hypothetical protein [Dehalococcoidales bacterium]
MIQQTACDYLVANSREKSAYFIELKGSDVYKAYEQIQQTIFHVKDKLRGFTVNVRVIPTKVAVPDIQNDSKTLLFRKLIKSFDGDLKIKSISMIEKI